MRDLVVIRHVTTELEDLYSYFNQRRC